MDKSINYHKNLNKELIKIINKNIEILGDKGYSGLNEYKVTIPIKRK